MDGTITKRHALICGPTVIRCYGIRVWVKLLFGKQKKTFLEVIFDMEKKCPICGKEVNCRKGEETAVIYHQACLYNSLEKQRERSLGKLHGK